MRYKIQQKQTKGTERKCSLRCLLFKPMKQLLKKPAFYFLLLAAGCASKEPATPPARPGSGIAEYREVVGKAQNAVQAALTSLAAVGAQSNRSSPEVLTNFSAEVQRLQVGSIQMRARSEAIQARGDAYFEHWNQNLARVKDPEVRALAQQNRPRLQQSFGEIKRLTLEGREAFKPFLSELRHLRTALERDPASLSSTDAQNWISSAREHGQKVEQCLASIKKELDSMTAMITPPGKAAPQASNRHSPHGANPKSEARNPKQTSISKSKCSKLISPASFEPSSLEFVACFGFRTHSLRYLLTKQTA